jgi:hypothetical protein
MMMGMGRSTPCRLDNLKLSGVPNRKRRHNGRLLFVSIIVPFETVRSCTLTPSDALPPALRAGSLLALGRRQQAPSSTAIRQPP